MTYSDNVDKLVGDDGLTTTVVLELEGAHHVKSVLLWYNQVSSKSDDTRQSGKKKEKEKKDVRWKRSPWQSS